MKIKKYLENFNLSNKLVFLVGGNGQIGSEVVKFLKDCEAKIIILDNEKLKTKSKNIKYHYFNCANDFQ